MVVMPLWCQDGLWGPHKRSWGYVVSISQDSVKGFTESWFDIKPALFHLQTLSIGNKKEKRGTKQAHSGWELAWGASRVHNLSWRYLRLKLFPSAQVLSWRHMQTNFLSENTWDYRFYLVDIRDLSSVLGEHLRSRFCLENVGSQFFPSWLLESRVLTLLDWGSEICAERYLYPKLSLWARL